MHHPTSSKAGYHGYSIPQAFIQIFNTLLNLRVASDGCVGLLEDHAIQYSSFVRHSGQQKGYVHLFVCLYHHYNVTLDQRDVALTTVRQWP